MQNTMNYLNRSLAIVFLLLLCLTSVCVGGAAGYDLARKDGLRSSAGLLSNAIDTAALRSHQLLIAHGGAVLGVCGLVALLTLLLLWAELRSAVTQPQLVLSRGHLGQVAISLDQVGVLAQHEAELVSGVREVHTTAQAQKGGIRVQQTIAVEPEQQLPALAEQIQQRVKQSLEFHLGFPVAAVKVQLQQSSLSKVLL